MTCTPIATRAEEPGAAPPPPERSQPRRGEVGPEADGRRPRGPAPMQVIEQFRTIAAELNLTDEQKTKVETALKTAREAFDEVRDDLESMEPRDRRERVEPIFADLRKSITETLSEEQRQTLRKRMAELRPGGAGAGGQRPGGAGPGGGPTTRPGALLERFRENVEKLGLSDDQKKRIESVLADAKAQFEEVREGLMSGDEQARMKAGELTSDLRRQIGEILTVEQREQMRKLMAPPGGGDGQRPPPNDRRRRGPGGEEMRRPGEGDMMDGEMRTPPRPGERPGGARRPPRDERRARGPTTGPVTLGAPAPELELTKLDGRPVRLSSSGGRVGVIVFGSYSSPSFRQRAAALEQLAKQFGSRAQFVIVYTKEAHPTGEWDVDRNREEGIAVEAHKDAAARLAQAEKAKEALGLTIPIAPDTMDDAAATAFGAFPNGAIVIARDGTIAARQQWLDPDGLERRIEQALKVPATKPAR